MARDRRAWVSLYTELLGLSEASQGSGHERRYLAMARTVEGMSRGKSAEVSLDLLLKIETLLDDNYIETSRTSKVRDSIRAAIRRAT